MRKAQPSEDKSVPKLSYEVVTNPYDWNFRIPGQTWR